MRALRTLIIYIAVVFLGGALLAPWVYWLVQSIAHSFPQVWNEFFPKIAGAPFYRYVNRALLGLALIGLWPFLKNFGATSASDLGLVNPAGQGRKIGGGFLLGFGSLAMVAGLAIVSGARHFNGAFSGKILTEKLLGVVATAVIVALLEEILFRGGLFGALKKVFHWKFALAVNSVVYALVHFMESAREPAVVTWYSGLAILPQMLRGFTDWHAVIPGFFNLTLAGAILALAYQRTGNLYFSIGLHAGWIFWLKAYGILTVAAPRMNTWCWGQGKLAVVNGWIALPVLAATLFIFARLSGAKQNPTRL